MSVLHVSTANCELLPNGRLTRLSDWNREVAAALADKEGLDLTDEHWQVIEAIRDFYHEYNISPIRKLLKKSLAECYGPDKASDEHLNRLFAGGVEAQGTRLAGVPEPLLDAELEPGCYTASTLPNAATAAHFVDQFAFEGRTYRVYSRGNLADPSEWNAQLAEFMAQKEGLDLTAEHWEIIDFLRKFYFQYGISPMVRLMMNHMKSQFGEDKSSEAYLYRLFPGGPARQGSRIAGLPEPQGCVDP